MAFSVESRVPFLTHDFAEFLMSLPPEYLISKSGVRKYVFREAMRGVLPEAIRTRGDKIGFTADDGVWLRASCSRSDPVWEELRQLPMFRPAQFDTFIADFFAGRHQRAALVWRSLIFGLWTRAAAAAASNRA
jgi:asparagine synthase (glutamine-hydrolysing)